MVNILKGISTSQNKTKVKNRKLHLQLIELVTDM